MRKALACVRMRRRKHIRKGLADHADDGWHLGDVRNPFRTQPVADKQNQRRQAIEHPGQPPPALVGIDHHEAEMGDFHRLAIEFDLHHRQRVEGDRPPGRFLADQRDDGARQPFAVAGEDAVGEAFLRQCLGRHDAQLRRPVRRVRLRKATARGFDDARDQAGMGAQGEIDGRLAQRLQPEHAIAAQTSGRGADLPQRHDGSPNCRSRKTPCHLPALGPDLCAKPVKEP